jgi:Raf kinase inhibitor-like YbhB/YbcL family protein
MSTVMDKAKQLVGQILRNVRSSPEKMASAKMRPERELEVSSESFDAGMPIPAKYTQDGENISASLEWAGVPADAVSLAIVCEDPDAPSLEPIVHWIVYDVPPGLSGFPEGLPAGDLPMGGKQGKNYVGEERYIGPKPPLGHGPHHYHFQVFALDRELIFGGPPDKNAMVDAMRGHVLAQGEIVGTYERTAE